MSPWPSLDRGDDLRLALSLAADDDAAAGDAPRLLAPADALAQVVDRYAARLYDYAHALLRDQETAAWALHDSFLQAYAHAGVLREPVRFRSWLYALVRNECLRRRAEPGFPTERREAPEVEDVFLDAPERAQRIETRRLVHGAMAGLRGSEREALDLLLRHGLEAAEVGAVLGVDARQAADLTGAARQRLDDALAAALIARDGRAACPQVAELVEEGEGPLPPATARRLLRHISHCATCTELRYRRVSTARLLQVLPVALLPSELPAAIMATATAPAAAGELAEAARRAEPFDTWGWPVPVARSQGRAARNRGPVPRLLPAVAAAAGLLLIVTGAFILVPLVPLGSGERTGAVPKSSSAAPDPSASDSSGDPSAGPSQEPSPSESPSSEPSETPTTPTPSPSTSSKAPTPRTSARPSHRTPTPSRDAPAGRLVVGGCEIPDRQSSCSFSVRAVGGPVTWSVTRTSGVTASGGGRLAGGGSASVTASRPNDCPPGPHSGSVSFAPSGTATVTWTCPDDTPPDGGDGGQAGDPRAGDPAVTG